MFCEKGFGRNALREFYKCKTRPLSATIFTLYQDTDNNPLVSIFHIDPPGTEVPVIHGYKQNNFLSISFALLTIVLRIFSLLLTCLTYVYIYLLCICIYNLCTLYSIYKVWISPLINTKITIGFNI